MAVRAWVQLQYEELGCENGDGVGGLAWARMPKPLTPVQMDLDFDRR